MTARTDDAGPLTSLREIRRLNEFDRQLIVKDNSSRLLSAVRAQPSTGVVPPLGSLDPGEPSITKEAV